MKKKMKVKICLFGEGEVGKTSTIGRYVYNVFDDSYLKTIGTKISKKIVVADFPDVDLQVEVTMNIWDIMGQRDYLNILKTTYFHGAMGLIAVTDLTRKSTLTDLEIWLNQIKAILPDDVPLIMLGNKNDLVDEHEYGIDDIKDFGAKFDAIECFTTSAKTGEHIEEAFMAMAQTLGKAALKA